MTIRIETGDCLEVLRNLPPCFRVNCCVTSPPYFGLRDYGHAGQIGSEATVDEYVSRLVEVFRAVRDHLADDGTLWLNLGDSYLEKSLQGVPWRVAFALLADGWYLRSDIIWSKPNPMPESITDRPTKAHEYIFLMSKSPKYYYDAAAIAEPSEYAGEQAGICRGTKRRAEAMGRKPSGNEVIGANWIQPETRNKRTVWTVVTAPFHGAHFATFPPDLIEPCIKAGCPVGGTVLDPFGGAGTTGLVADRLQRNALLIELNPEYATMARHRIHNDAPLFSSVS
jgi:DNA modification methylase